MGSFRMVGFVAVGITLAYLGCSTEETTSDDDQSTATGSTTSSTGTGTGASTGTTTGAGGSAPLTCPSPYTNMDGDCDMLAQDCTDDTWCTVSGFADPPESQCLPFLGGLKQAGSDCGSTGECGYGLRCIDNRCSPVCCPDTDEPCGGGQCDIRVRFSTTHWAMFCSYSQACQLFEQDCPQDPEPSDCHVSDPEQGLAVCDERTENWVPEGGACEYRNDCGDSQRCNRSGSDVDPDAGVAGRCRYHCLVTQWESLTPGTGGCVAGQHCVDLGWLAFQDVGLCIPD